MTSRTGLVALLALLGACHGEPPTAASARDAALAGVTGDALRDHIRFLAADELEGREAGTAAYGRAADYVAAALQKAGLEGALGKDDYLQPIRFFETRLVPDSARLLLDDGQERLELVFRDDFVRSGGYGDAQESITAPLVFVGYGITAPEYGHDDFAGIEVDGRILVVLSGAPPQFDTDQRAYYSSTRGKEEAAVARGARGIIVVRTPVDQARRPWARYLPGIGSPGMRWLDADNEPYQGFPELAGNAVLSESGAAKLFSLTGRNLDVVFERHAAGETGSFDMGVTAELSRQSKQRTVESANVIAKIDGSDPMLADEYVLFTAHLDHIGLRPSESGDEIHNGAYDNAAGVAVLLEIAGAMAAMPLGPRRSVLFAAVTAEEKGLQGSGYLAKNPPVAASRLVANINIDMPYLGFPVADIQAFGAEHSTLGAAVGEATATMGMGLTPDPMPEEVRFVRSDQFSFVKEGIPALAFKAGSQSSDPAIDGEAMLADFLKNHYHQPSDDLDLPYSSAGAARFAQTALLLGLIVADGDRRPRWHDGDFFGDKFAP